MKFSLRQDYPADLAQGDADERLAVAIPVVASCPVEACLEVASCPVEACLEAACLGVGKGKKIAVGPVAT